MFLSTERGVKVGSESSHWLHLGILQVLVFNDLNCMFQCNHLFPGNDTGDKMSDCPSGSSYPGMNAAA